MCPSATDSEYLFTRLHKYLCKILYEYLYNFLYKYLFRKMYKYELSIFLTLYKNKLFCMILQSNFRSYLKLVKKLAQLRKVTCNLRSYFFCVLFVKRKKFFVVQIVCCSDCLWFRLFVVQIVCCADCLLWKRKKGLFVFLL